MTGLGRTDLRLFTVPAVMKQSGCSCVPSPKSAFICCEHSALPLDRSAPNPIAWTTNNMF